MFVGAAHEITAHLDITEVAKRIRADLRNARDRGALPSGMGFSVKTSRFAGGQSLDVTLTGMPDTWTYLTPGQPCDYPAGIAQHGGQSQAAKTAVAFVREVVSVYNRDNSDTQSDYFDVRFYGDVNIRDEAAANRRAR